VKNWLLRLLALSFVFSGAVAQTLSKEIRTRIMQSVVEVLALENDAGAPRYQGQGGSGTVISTSGFILTNYHVVTDDDNREIKRHAIRFTDTPTKEPIIKAIATIVATLPKLDLALLKITQDDKGNPIPASSRYVASPVGNPFEMVLGERLTFAGYPGIGGRTITFTTGVFSGWTGENYRSSGTNWIKTDGKITSGNSGGGAFDEQGNLVGVPTGGITRRLSQTLTESQNYLRPIHLAYQIFEPNVADTLWAGGRKPTLPADVDATGLVSATVVGGLLPAKVGQIWLMTIEGLPAWTLQYNRLDQDGDPTGPATQAGSSQGLTTYAYEDDEGRFLFHVENQRNEAWACAFEDPVQFAGQTLSSGEALNSPPDADSWNPMRRPCTVSLQSGTVAAPPKATDLPTAPGALVAAFPPKPGQTWTVTIAGLEPWTLEFQKLDRDGDPEGISKQGAFSGPAFAFADGSDKVFQFFSNAGGYWCVFANNAVFSGATISGGRAFFRATNAQSPSPMNRDCSATIISAGSPALGLLAPLEKTGFVPLEKTGFVPLEKLFVRI
jgi:serine protease Do